MKSIGGRGLKTRAGGMGTRGERAFSRRTAQRQCFAPKPVQLRLQLSRYPGSANNRSKSVSWTPRRCHPPHPLPHNGLSLKRSLVRAFASAPTETQVRTIQSPLRARCPEPSLPLNGSGTSVSLTTGGLTGVRRPVKSLGSRRPCRAGGTGTRSTQGCRDSRHAQSATQSRARGPLDSAQHASDQPRET